MSRVWPVNTFRHLFFKFFLFFLMTLIASIITFSKKKILEKKMLPSTLDMEPSTLDPRQKDRLELILVWIL